MIKSPTFYEPDLSSGPSHLGPEESGHCIRVLRKRPGDHIRIIDGKGLEVEAEITNPDPKKCEFNIIQSNLHEQKHFIHVAIAPTKQVERLEWFMEKAVEIGVQSVSFVSCYNSERRHLNLNRLEKKAISALKQSGNLFYPSINPLIKYKEFITTCKEEGKFIAYLEDPQPAHLMSEAKGKSTHLVLIGPEGDFSNEEVSLAKSNGFVPVSLGESRLRTETAGIAACHILNLLQKI